MLGRIIAFRDDVEQPHAHLTLANGDRLVILLDRSGVTITKIGADPKMLFQANSEIVSRLCASFLDPKRLNTARSLQILAAVVLQLEDAASVERTFREVTAKVY
jgi:hypothetical protein